MILQACSFIMCRHAQSYLSSAITGASGIRVCKCLFRSCVDVCRLNCAAAAGDGGAFPVPFSISARRILHRDRASVASCHAQIPHETLRLFQKQNQSVLLLDSLVFSRAIWASLFYVGYIIGLCSLRCLAQMFVICNFFMWCVSRKIKTECFFIKVHGNQYEYIISSH